MKANKFITAALLSTLALGAFATVTQADSKVPSGGTVEVGDGELDPETDKKDPEKPVDPIITDDKEVTPGKDKGNLIILGVSNLKFGKIETGAKNIIQAASATTVKLAEYDADGKLVEKTDSNGDTITKKVGNFIQFGDIRSDKFGYELSAKMTKQFTGTTDTTKTLANTSIEYTNGLLTHGEADDTAYTHPALAKAGFSLELNDLEPVVDFTATEGGKGIYSVEYGQTSAYEDKYTVNQTPAVATKGTEANSVFMNVPKLTATNMTKDNYESEVEWILVAK